MKNKRKQINSVKKYFFSLFLIIFLIFFVATSNSNKNIITNNINTVKAVQSSKIENIMPLVQYVQINSLQEIANLSTKKVKFIGTLTGYGPDCVGCNGKTGCFPYQNVLNENIYYEDDTYGKIRILAADKLIPCGSIVKISNYQFIEGDFYGIVLDRGSAINGLTMDLLYNSENDTIKIGRNYDINFQIERWGF